MKRWVSPVLLLLLVLGLLAFRYCQSRHAGPMPASPTTTHSKPDRSRPSSATRVPDYALEVLRYIREHGEAPPNHVGGREFQNRENRLPKKDDQGRRLRYSEWDVHPKVPGQNRGPERLITGSDHSAWFTADHYRTFQQIE